MQLANQEALYNLFLNEVMKYEKSSTQVSEVNEYIQNLLDKKYDLSVLDKSTLITALNTLSFNLYCNIIKKLEVLYPGFLLLMTATVLNNIKDDCYRGDNKIDKFYLEHSPHNIHNVFLKIIWDEQLQKITKEVLLDKYYVNESEFFFARVKLLFDSKILPYIVNNEFAFEFLVYNDYTISLISKIAPIFSGYDNTRVKNKQILIQQYCNLLLNNRNEDDFFESLHKAKIINVDNNILNAEKYKDNTEVQTHLKEYLLQLKKVKREVLLELTDEIITVLNRLSIENFIDIFSFLDQNHPGLSIHFVMEGRHQESEECIKLLKTIKQLDKDNNLGKIFSPTRVRLARELLKTDNDDEEIDLKDIEINNAETFIDLLKNSEIFNVEDREE